MKRLLLALIFAAAPLAAQTLDPVGVGVSGFGGINVYNDSTQIGDADAIDAQNVFTDRGFLEKRDGNVYFANLISSYAVAFANQFVAPSNTSYIISASSAGQVFATSIGGTRQIASVTPSFPIDSVTAYGRHVIVNGEDQPFYYNGIGTAAINYTFQGDTMPVGGLVEFDKERLWLGNIPLESAAEVRTSAFGSIGIWTIPSSSAPSADSATAFLFNPDDGEGVTCLKATPWGMYAGKRHSSWIEKGSDNSSWYQLNIDPVVGCVDDRTVQMVDGVLVVLAVDGVYGWAGSGPMQLISRDVTRLVQQIRQINSAAGAWIVNRQADWQAGTITLNGPSFSWDTVSMPNYIFPSSQTFIDNSTATFGAGIFVNVTTAVFVGDNLDTGSLWQGINLPPLVNDTEVIGQGLPMTGLTLSLTTASWTHLGGSSYTVSNASAAVYTAGSDFSTSIGTSTNYGIGYGTVSFSTRIKAGAAATVAIYFQGTASTTGSPFFAPTGNGYLLLITGAAPACGAFPAANGAISLRRETGGGSSPVLISSSIKTTDALAVAYSSFTAWTIYRDAANRFYLRANGLLVGTAVDGTYALAPFIILRASQGTRCSVKTPSNGAYFMPFHSSGTFTSRTFDAQFSTPLPGPFSSTSTIKGFNVETAIYYSVRTSSDAANWTSWAATSDTLRTSTMIQRYWQYKADLWNLSLGTTTPQIQTVSMTAASTGVYYSYVNFIGISSQTATWRSFNSNDGGAPWQYSLRSASYPFLASDLTPAWVAQPNNAFPAIPVNPYVQFKIDSSGMSSSSQNFATPRVALSWQTGLAASAASGYLNHRYWLCGAFSTFTFVNDGCLVWQQNKKWTTWKGPSPGAIAPYYVGNTLIMGSGNTDSTLWKMMQPGVYTDSGTAITAYWTTKDYTFGSPFQQKSIREIWTDAYAIAGGSMTVSYTVDKSTVSVARVINLDSKAAFISKKVPIDASFILGKFLRFNFSDATAGQYMRLNNFSAFGDIKARLNDLQ